MSVAFPPPASDWWKSEMGRRTCRKCGEDRLTHSVTDFRGEQVFCQVCAHAWWALGKPRNWKD